jgi:3-(3-hydroxy-phenyl)propionate hydroxylase
METFRFAPPYSLPTFPFVTPPELKGSAAVRYPVIIVGAGPAGLTLACDLAQRGVPAVLLDEDNTVGVRGASSRGICYAQKSLEVLDRLGIADRVVSKGVTWSAGKTFSGTDEVYQFNLQTDSISCQPPFVNLQQFYLEGFLVDRIVELGVVDLRWKHHVTHVAQEGDHVVVTVETPEGKYRLEADWLIDATGANSGIRTQLGVRGHASRSTDRWCISDVRFTEPLPVERWTWVDAPFNDGRGVWQHLMADGVWRVDYQMPEDADPEAISRPEVAGERLRRQLGPDVDFEFVWIGPYGYRDHLLDEFRHDRVIFIGDAAHVVSPFGARGGNTGIQDAANLGWKLTMATRGQAPESLLDSYNTERHAAAAENLAVTSRTARFMAPRSAAERTLRFAVVSLAKRFEFARKLVNTGRMSVANAYPASRWLPEGGRSVQNLELRRENGQATRLMALLREHTKLLALWYGATSTQLANAAELEQRYPLQIMQVNPSSSGSSSAAALVDEDCRLAAHLGLPADEHRSVLFVIRPDGYLAATLLDPSDSALEATLRVALSLD